MSAGQLEVDFSAAEKRDAGQATALEALPASVVRALQRAVESFAGRAVEFTSDMVWDALTYAEREVLHTHPNAMGAIFRQYAKSGAIEPTGRYVRSQLPKARKRRLTVWRWTRGA